MKRDEIDEIMEEMEAKTPKFSDKTKSFDNFENGNSSRTSDMTDAKQFKTFDFFKTSPKAPITNKPGLIYPSRPTTEKYYDFTHKNIGVAIIFNQIRFSNQEIRKGSSKDADDLKNTLEQIGFETKICTDFKTEEIRELLKYIAEQDHSDNDCLLITMMTHGKQNGRIFARDGELFVDELWENFLGENCKTLIGKPKLFFIQACRGTMTDPGSMLKIKPKNLHIRPLRSDAVDSKRVEEEIFIIPSLADILIMYSTAEGYYSFRNPTEGSWFIQALCEELCENSHEEIMTILTGVNRKIAFAKQSFIPNSENDAMKQMPVIQSMLTKQLYFLKKDQKTRIRSSLGKVIEKNE